MSEASSTQSPASNSDIVRAPRDVTPRGIAFEVLSNAIEDVELIDVRARIMFHPVGLNGETFSARWERVRRIVTRRNTKKARAAWRAAIQAGWTEKELNAAGLSRA